MFNKIIGEDKKTEKEKKKQQLIQENNKNYSKKAEELKFNDKIDDAYTNKLVDKYEKGHQKNRWFIASAISSIVFGGLCILAILIANIVLAIKSGNGEYDMDENKNKLITASVILIIYGIFSILIGFKINTFSNYTREMLMANTAKITFFAVLQMLFGGIIFSVLSFVGYFTGRGIDYGAIYYNRIDGYNKDDGVKYEEDDDFQYEIVKKPKKEEKDEIEEQKPSVVSMLETQKPEENDEKPREINEDIVFADNRKK